jgi:hypothetical protein
MFMPSGSNGKTDMFWAAPWNATEQSNKCFKSWGLRPRQDWAAISFG